MHQKAQQSRNACEKSHPNSPQYCNNGYQTFMNSIPQLCKGQNRKEKESKKKKENHSSNIYLFIYLVQLIIVVVFIL